MADRRPDDEALPVRRYGTQGPVVFVLHGGPGAPGTMAALARGLEDAFRVVEPFQRRSERGGRLTVRRHVEDLHNLVMANRDTAAPALVGSSWGAMLALSFAAAYPEDAGPLVLIGCGTFDADARRRFEATVADRMNDALRRCIEDVEGTVEDPDERLAAIGRLLLPVYSYDPDLSQLGIERCDARGHEETWTDMLELQAQGVYPSAFSAIRSPVVMLHGAHDPHPGAMIRASLAPHVPQLQYVEWERCGHYPWIEKAVRDELFDILRAWLLRHIPTPPAAEEHGRRDERPGPHTGPA